MPKGFTEAEKDRIRARLLTEGETFLITQGIRKTSIEDLAKAAYISKGAFYFFFHSKEELFYTLLQQFEAAYQQQLLKLIERPGETPLQRMIAFLQDATQMWQSTPLFTHFGNEDFEFLARKLPPEFRLDSIQTDVNFFEGLIQQWKALGVTMTCTAEEFVGIARVLFFATLHADDIGETYAKTRDTLIELIAQHLLRI